MNRRALLAGLGGTAVLARVPTLAQRAQSLPRVALMSNNMPMAQLNGPDPIDPNVRAFVHGLRDLGWVEGRSIVIERRSAEGRPERIPALMREVVDLKVDLILAYGPAMALAARQATESIPIVALGPDLVALGLATSLARPGGNVTGLTFDVGSALDGKRLEFVKQLVPKATRVAFIRSRPLPGRPVWDADTEAAALALGLSLQMAAVDSPEDFDVVFAAIERDRPGAIFCVASPVNFGNRQRIIDFAARQRLPAVYALRAFAESGGLLSYGADWAAVSRRAASHVDKILKGAKPGELPIEQPTKFELVINLKTAKSLGLTIPPLLLLRADEVIE